MNATHITQLTAENILRLEAVEIAFEPTGGLTIIGGKNGAGKTSVLNAIAMALGGRKLCPEEPINRKSGATKASVKVTLDNGLVVERRFTPKGDYLHVAHGEDGPKVSSPQAVLDELVGALTFDPLAFARMSSEERSATLHGIVDVDVSSFDTRHENLYETRRDVNRSLRDAEGALNDMPPVEGNVPEEEISISDLSQELERCQTHNTNVQKLADNVEAKERQLEVWRQQHAEALVLVEQRQRELAQAQERLATANDHIDQGKQEIAEAVKASEGKQPVDTKPIRDQITQADEINRAVRAKKARAAQAAKVKALQKESDDLTANMETLQVKKQKALAEAKYPIDGLTLTPDGAVVYKNVPFEQAADSEKLRVSLAIGAALNPTLRFCGVRDGSLLDEQSLIEVAKMAKEADLRVLLERVGEGQECSVIIEEGRVKP